MHCNPSVKEGTQHSIEGSPTWQDSRWCILSHERSAAPKMHMLTSISRLWTCCSFCSEQIAHSHIHTLLGMNIVHNIRWHIFHYYQRGWISAQEHKKCNVYFALTQNIHLDLSPYSAKWRANLEGPFNTLIVSRCGGKMMGICVISWTLPVRADWEVSWPLTLELHKPLWTSVVFLPGTLLKVQEGKDLASQDPAIAVNSPTTTHHPFLSLGILSKFQKLKTFDDFTAQGPSPITRR